MWQATSQLKFLRKFLHVHDPGRVLLITFSPGVCSTDISSTTYFNTKSNNTVFILTSLSNKRLKILCSSCNIFNTELLHILLTFLYLNFAVPFFKTFAYFLKHFLKYGFLKNWKNMVGNYVSSITSSLLDFPSTAFCRYGFSFISIYDFNSLFPKTFHKSAFQTNTPACVIAVAFSIKLYHFCKKKKPSIHHVFKFIV